MSGLATYRKKLYQPLGSGLGICLTVSKGRCSAFTNTDRYQPNLTVLVQLSCSHDSIVLGVLLEDAAGV